MTKSEENKTDRRGFLRRTAIVGVATTSVAATVNSVFPSLVPEASVFETNRSLWAQALPEASLPLQKDIEVDVAVIGGGFTGLSAAYYLKKNSEPDRVALLEAVRCGNGASGRNGAMLLTATEDRYMEWSGDPGLDKRIYDLTADNARRLLALSAQLNCDAEIEINGALQMCNTREIAKQAREYAEKAQRAGIPCEFWDQQKIVSVVGTSAYPAALYDPNSGQVHPGKLVRMFKRAAELTGVEIYEQSPVVHMEEDEFAVITLANGKTVRARNVILATNAYSSKLGYLRRAVTPVFDYVAVTAPLQAERLAEIGWNRRIPFNDSRTEVFYLGLTKDNRVHIGGGHVDYVFNNGLAEPSKSERRFTALREELGRIYPGLASEPFEVCWSGAVDMSLDQTPSVGQFGKHDNLFYAIGFSGHGVNLTSVFGRILADLVHGKTAEWAWLPYLNRLPLYTPNEPFRWAGVQAALGYYRMTDPK
jgi:glycine/D-amino acid oxidase-like deaminating enzyme